MVLTNGHSRSCLKSLVNDYGNMKKENNKNTSFKVLRN